MTIEYTVHTSLYAQELPKSDHWTKSLYIFSSSWFSKFPSPIHALSGVKMCPAALNRRSHAALASRGVFVSHAALAGRGVFVSHAALASRECLCRTQH